MWSRSPNRRALVAWIVAASLGALTLSSAALAVAPPVVSGPLLTHSPAAFSFSASPDDPLTGVITGYEGGVVASADAEPADPLTSPASFDLADGNWFFRVRAVQSDLVLGESRSDYQTKAFRVDNTPPAPPVPSFSPARANGDNGWWTSLTIHWSCPDPFGATCPDQAISASARGQVARQRATDAAGNVSALASTAPFNFDNGAPQPAISSPTNGARVTGEPTFTWVKVNDPTSGGNRTEVYARWSGVGDQLIARSAYPSTSTKRNVRATALPEGVTITWYIKFFDNAGNWRLSNSRTFTILPTPPSDAPVITGGPAGPTNVPAPVFTWTGDQPGFAWDVTRAGAATPLQKGSGAAKQAKLSALTDGDYTFRVSQVTALRAEGPEATRSFTVDTARPVPPVITARPAPATATPAGFAWTTESGALSRWQVLDASGAVVKGPSDALDPAVNVGPLATGTYTFRVTQVDPAGNVSDPTSESFSVQSSVATTTGTPQTPPRIALPKQNAGRLTPRAGTRIATLRPIFRWKKGPPGTTLYNLQLFRVVKRDAGKAPSIKKIISVFPRGLRWKPKAKVTPGLCYVWRVWPYTGTSFTPKPLGISNFCVMSAKALKRSKARAKARHQTAAARVG